MEKLPLCVDCDGTLIRTDLLHESVLAAVKQSPLVLLQSLAKLLHGRAILKSYLASRVSLDISYIPLREDVLKIIHDARAEGRSILLVTASPESQAYALNLQHRLFDEVIATKEGGPNLSGKTKADLLVERFGVGRFDYVGDSWKDIPVWAKCRQAIVVSNSRRLVSAVRSHVGDVSQVNTGPITGSIILKAMRLHQWAKNILIFVPLIAAHGLSDFGLVCSSLIAFLAFSFCASSVYVINDLLDLQSDRRHIRKRYRPFASGHLSILNGVWLALTCISLSILCSSGLGLTFQAVLATYFALTLGYSVKLKEQVIVDVMMLAALYTMRIVAGATATKILPSFWLLAFSMFVFLSLALLKRYTDLRQQEALGTLKAAGRGYLTSDLPVLNSLGTSSAMVGVMVFALFINSPGTTASYRQPIWLWLIPPLLMYWSARIWLKAHRGQVHDDPLVFALKDWQSLTVLIIAAVIFTLAH
jgi:4-hydroxybenzoate polyprenyltransferase/phosphoserine phosphatase